MARLQARIARSIFGSKLFQRRHRRFPALLNRLEGEIPHAQRRAGKCFELTDRIVKIVDWYLILGANGGEPKNTPSINVLLIVATHARIVPVGHK